MAALEEALPWLPSPLALVVELADGAGEPTGPDWFHEAPLQAERKVEVVLSAGATRLGSELVAGTSWLLQRAADSALDGSDGPHEAIGVDGDRCWIRTVARPMEGGVVVDFVRQAVGDPTDQGREALFRVDALEKVIEALPVALFLKDPRDSYRIKRVNRAFEETFGLRREDVIDVFDHELFPEDLCARYRAVDEAAFRDARVIRVEEEIQTPRGPRIAETVKLPLFDDDGRPELLVGILQDVTDFKQAAGAAEEAKVLKGRLLHGLGSGARSALTSLIERLDESLLAVTMQDGHVESSIEQARRIARDLELQIAEVLDVSHVACGRRAVNWSSFDPAEVAAMCLANGRRAAVQEGVELELIDRRAAAFAGKPAGLMVEGDPGRLSMALAQILSNGIKFSPAGATVRVVLDQPSPARRVRISVVDEGIGIPEDELDALFHGVSSSVGPGQKSLPEGAGLGLAIARQLVEAMDGTLSVESHPGVGSSFHIELAALSPERAGLGDLITLRNAPAQQDAAQQDAAQQGTARQDTRDVAPVSEALLARFQRVIVADDNVAHRRIIRRHLEADGHGVTTTGRVEEVLAVLHSPSEMVDVILVDLRMPGVDCFDLVKAMSDWAAGLPGAQAAPRIIGMSSFAPGSPEAAQEEERAVKAGAEGCLFKPIRPRDLAACLNPKAS